MARRKVVEKKSRRGLIVCLALVTLAVLVVAAPLFQPKPQAVTAVQPALPVEESAEIKIQRMQGTIQGVLEDARNDSIPGIRQLTKEMFRRLDAGQLGLAVSPVYNGQVLAAIVIRPNEAPIISFAGPKLERLQQALPPEQFRDELLCLALHEVIHVLYTPAHGEHQDRQRYVDGETKAWALTVTEVVRPLQKLGRSVGRDNAEASKAYRKCGNSLASKTWRQWVDKHHCYDKDRYVAVEAD